MKNLQEAQALRVVDTSVTEANPERIHEVFVKGELHQITFRHGENTILPFEIGVKFSGLQGFDTFEIDGSQLDMPAKPTENVAAQLAPDECVAKFSELTFSSLKIRAAQKFNGEIYSNAKESDRKNLIAFLSGAGPDENLIEEDDEEAQGEDEDKPDEIAVDADDEFITQEQFKTIMLELFEKYGADNYTSEPESGYYKLYKGDPDVDGNLVAEGTMEELIINFDPSSVVAANFPATAEIIAPHVEGANIHGIGPDEPLGDNPNFVSNPEDTKEVVSENQPETEIKAEESDEKKYTVAEVKAATDAAIELAAQYAIDLSGVKGSGANGNILKGDVEEYIAENKLSPIASE